MGLLPYEVIAGIASCIAASGEVSISGIGSMGIFV